MKNCPKSKCIGVVISVALFMFVYDMLVHGFLLAGAYAETAALWRPAEEMQNMGWYCIALHLVIAYLICALYCMATKKTEACATDKKGKKAPEENKCCPVKHGVCFGTILGLILGVTNASAYMHLPMPGSLAVSWFFASLFQGVGVGLILGLLTKKKQGQCNA